MFQMIMSETETSYWSPTLIDNYKFLSTHIVDNSTASPLLLIR